MVLCFLPSGCKFSIMKCDNCGLDLSGTRLFERVGTAILCLPCSVVDEHTRECRRWRKIRNDLL
jgi:hypothetical protein